MNILYRQFFYLFTALLLSACTSDTNVTASSVDASEIEHLRIAFGGRIFDMWYDDIDTDFVPDDPETPEIDGLGGPNGNGTLNRGDGSVVANNGHNYRFKNLFGWDMRGDAGIYGAAYQAKEFVLPEGPLSDGLGSLNRAQWIDRISNGYGDLPAYKDVMNPLHIAALVDYMLGVRDGRLPHPDSLYSLSTESPKGFVMAPGGDAARGHALYAEQCAACHGADATAIIFDNGEQSLGQHARYYGYAVTMITLAGEPGSEMGPQIPAGMPVSEQTQTLLDIIAALCDRQKYPVGAATDPDVPDNDPRCGAHLH